MKRIYGAPWYHLVLHLALVGVLIWTITKVADIRAAGNVLAWFVAALILHDLILVPVYSALDSLAQRLDGRRARGRSSTVPLINYLRVPAVLSAMLFLGFPGLILGKSNGTLLFVSGETPSGYALRWALVCLAMFVISGVIWALRHQQLQEPTNPAGDEHATAA